MFVVFSFVSAVDLLVALEEDGLIAGVTEIFVREVPALPHSPPGTPGVTQCPLPVSPSRCDPPQCDRVFPVPV